MRAPISLDLHITNFNYPDTPPERLLERLTEIAQTAEQAGFSSLTVMDHLYQIQVVGPEENYMLEGNMALTALAAVTEKVSLGMLVGGVTYRNPALLAKMTTTLDVLSGGRAVFGIGAAWNESEHLGYGYRFPPLKERFEHLEDALRIARAMFTQERATVEGKHHHVKDVLNNPRPIRGDIPILIGGSGERKTLRLVAKYADACNLFGDVERTKHLLGVLEGHCEAVGRDSAEITKTRMASVIVGSTHEQAERKVQMLRESGVPDARIQMSFVGDPDALTEHAQSFADIGVEGMTVNLPDIWDTETIRLAGEAMAPVFSASAPAR